MFFIFSFVKCFWISLALWDLRHHVSYNIYQSHFLMGFPSLLC
ncbi:unnamed protein product [Brassica rapa subsp. trilocularis]